MQPGTRYSSSTAISRNSRNGCCPFAEQMEQDRCDVVYGVQERRKGSFSSDGRGNGSISSSNFSPGLALPEKMSSTARLMSQRYVAALLRHDEREMFLAGLWHITGFDQRPHTVAKHASSETTYTLTAQASNSRQLRDGILERAACGNFLCWRVDFQSRRSLHLSTCLINAMFFPPH